MVALSLISCRVEREIWECMRAVYPLDFLSMRKGRYQAFSLALLLWRLATFLFIKVCFSASYLQKYLLTIRLAYEGGPGSMAMPFMLFFSFISGLGGCSAFSGAIKAGMAILRLIALNA